MGLWGVLSMGRPTLEIYEFRMLNSAGTIKSATQEAHITDILAIRAARRIATGDPFEVWRGITCIYPAGLLPAKPTSAPGPPR